MGQRGSGSKNEVTCNRSHRVERGVGSGARTRTSSARCSSGELCARTGAHLRERQDTGCRSQRGSPSMREQSENLGRHPYDGWQVRQLGAKIVLWLYGAHRDSPRVRSGRSPLQSAPRPCRISHQSLKAPQAALGASGPKERSRTVSSGQRRGRDARLVWPHPCSVSRERLIRRNQARKFSGPAFSARDPSDSSHEPPRPL